MRVLFTEADWTAVHSDAPYPGQLVAERASIDVDLYLKSAVYDTDTNGFPVNADLKASLIASAIEQAYALALVDAVRKASTKNPLGVPLSSASIGGASWSAATGYQIDDGYALPPRTADVRLCGYARDRLSDFTRWVQIYG